MNYELEYPGREESGGVSRCFRWICPESSGVVRSQKTRLEPPGLTVVAHIPHEDRRPFQEAIRIIKACGRKFQACEQLHFTILGLFAEDLQEPLAKREVENLISAIGEFFRANPLGPITVDFDLLRPGLFLRKPARANGTVVAMASEAHDAIIVAYSKRLAAHLAGVYPNLFPEARRRPLGGVWCTLGFFDEPDFEIDEGTYNAFTSLIGFVASASITHVSICEFTLRSLTDGIVRGMVRL